LSVLCPEKSKRSLTGEVEAYGRDEEKSSAMRENIVSALRDRNHEGRAEDGDGQ